ncbi:MAG TPA: bifunctional oligoribonuclease/PAP phosphatase NrnA [Acidobacteriota bacterium]|nr:bifunctional oligoribonuclease/PAP phosphatase NrnA [Acidobacteriota bacterium]
MDSHKIAEFLRSATRLAVVSHQGPDGDSIGSSLALAHGLRGLGKQVDVLSAEPVPPVLAFLPGVADILQRRSVEGDYQGIVILECSDFQRTGLSGLEEHFTINIDHHPGGAGFADLNWVDETASAVGMLVDDLLLRLGAPLDADIATCLYLAVLTDTGSFQFSNTDASTFQAAARWVSAGADPGAIAHQVYRRQPEARLRLLGTALGRMQTDRQKGLAWIELRRPHLQGAAADIEHTEGLVNYPLSLEGIRASVVLREDSRGHCRVSLRSKGEIDVGGLARRMGGGGHLNAAGMTLQGDWSEIRSRVLRELGDLIEAGRGQAGTEEVGNG